MVGLSLLVARDDPKLRPNRRSFALYPPSDPRGRWLRQEGSYRGGSPEIERLLAWIDAVLSSDDEESAEMAIQSALLREQARAEGWFTEAARLLAEQAAPELQAAFARPDKLDVILGVWGEEEGWRPGLAGLSYAESKATRLSLNGLEAWEIAKHDEMLSRRRQRAGETLAVKTVDGHLRSAALKLQKLFMTTRKLNEPGLVDEDEDEEIDYFG